MADIRLNPTVRPAARRLALAALTLLVVASSGPAVAAAAEGQGITIELNKLEPNGQACRAYVVLNNGSGLAFESLKLDLVLFDADGVVAKRVAVETAPLTAGKTSLKVFDIDGLACDGITRMLLNDVLACEAGGGARSDCLGDITPTARGTVSFIK